MMNLSQAKNQLQESISGIYDSREAENISQMVMESITGWERIDISLNRQAALSVNQLERIKQIGQELLAHRPVQYVLGESWFAGMKFFVDENVLVPRPETDELVNWVAEEIDNGPKGKQDLIVMDVGTGSGCIAISVKKKIPAVKMLAVDVSDAALSIAKKNSKSLNAEIELIKADFLNPSIRQELPAVDILISNPPYIPKSAGSTMSPGVVNHEPSLALFVDDHHPLVFYHALSEFGKTHLHSGGMIFAEINELMGPSVLELFERDGWELEMRKDLQGKHRMIKAWKS